jgi:ABC-type transport system involved in multi-copper enzyme maturation permease subunit
MPLGPVFNAELLTTARRARYYVVRFLYGLIILFQIYTTYESSSWRFGNARRNLTINEMASFALQIFSTFAVLQAVVVLLLTPALVGGTIADERQRKTLHYLLTSRLSSAEIILGKLAARLLQVGVLVALGLPVVSLIGLFGGVDFQLLLLTYAGTFTTIYFLASVSIFLSVVSRRPREAISSIYVLELIWLFVPTLLINTMARWPAPWPDIAAWVNPVLEYVALTSPVHLMSWRLLSSPTAMVTAVAWGMGLQVLYGTFFVVLAMVRLRPSSRNDGVKSRMAQWTSRLTQKRKWFPRPLCGDDGMLWKEMHVARTGGVTKAALILLGVVMVGIIGYAGFEPFVAALDETLRDGYFTQGRQRSDFNGFVRSVCTLIYVLWFLGIASSSASGVSSEREEDQWITLTSTPLSGSEILRAKMIGPVYGLRLLAYLMFTLWGFGLVAGSLHPLAVVACLVEMVVFTWFLTALGTFFSLRSKNSTRSLATSMAILIFLNGGYLFCCIPLRADTVAIIAGSTPAIFAVSLFSFEDITQVNRYSRIGETLVACVMGVLFYGIAAAGLTASLFSMFDTVVDRPDRFRQDRTPNQQREFLKDRSKEIQFQDELA